MVAFSVILQSSLGTSPDRYQKGLKNYDETVRESASAPKVSSIHTQNDSHSFEKMALASERCSSDRHENSMDHSASCFQLWMVMLGEPTMIW